MGKRSTTSTKSGRAMNPADQARKYPLLIVGVSFHLVIIHVETGKEARRRELKKNKKQRQVVREAVIKSKDPKKVIEELERLDQMGLLHCFLWARFSSVMLYYVRRIQYP